MRLHIRHKTRYRYEQAPSLIVQALRLWPAATSMQDVVKWQVRIDGQLLGPRCLDGFGNPVATHTVDRAVDSVVVAVVGVADTHAGAGVHHSDAETLPPVFYQCPTPLIAATPEIAELARRCAGQGSALERLHRLCNGVRDRIDYVPRTTDAETTAARAFALRTGVCQDHAHVMIAAAHSLGFAARYVSGYLCPREPGTPAASHAWAEIHVAGLGWVGFDAANRQSPDEGYVRVACGRDYRDAAPVRGVYRGGAAETLEVDVSIAQVAPQQATQ